MIFSSNEVIFARVFHPIIFVEQQPTHSTATLSFILSIGSTYLRVVPIGVICAAWNSVMVLLEAVINSINFIHNRTPELLSGVLFYLKSGKRKRSMGGVNFFLYCLSSYTQ